MNNFNSTHNLQAQSSDVQEIKPTAKLSTFLLLLSPSPFFYAMEQNVKVLITGHSFVKRFHYFLKQRRDKRTLANLNLSSIEICFSGIRGRTVAKLRSFDLGCVRAFQPHVVILEIGSNDLCEAGQRPETIGLNIEDFVRMLHGQFNVKFVVVCQILNRATAPSQHPDFNLGVQVLNNYLKVVLEPLSYAEFWNHKGLRRPSIPMLRGMAFI